MSDESIMDSTEEPEVPQARQKSIRDPDIFTEFAEIEAKLFFAQEEEPRYERIKYEFDPKWNFRALVLSSYVWMLVFLLLRTQGIALWPLMWLAGFSLLLSFWFLGVGIYYGYTTDDTVNNYFLTESGYTRSSFILFMVTQCINFFFENDTETPIYELQASSLFC